MTTIFGLPGVPWAGATTPSANHQYSTQLGIGNNVNYTYGVAFPFTAQNTGIFLWRSDNSGGGFDAAGFNVGGPWTLMTLVNYVYGGSGRHCGFIKGPAVLKGDTTGTLSINSTTTTESGRTIPNWYAFYTKGSLGRPTMTAFTDNGNKLGVTPFNPVTGSWATWAAWSSGVNGVKKITLTTTPIYTWFYIAANSFTPLNTAQSYQIWNFTTSSWVGFTETFTESNSVFTFTSNGVFVGRIADYINGSNEMYIYYPSSTTTIGTPAILMGETTPQD